MTSRGGRPRFSWSPTRSGRSTPGSATGLPRPSSCTRKPSESATKARCWRNACESCELGVFSRNLHGDAFQLHTGRGANARNPKRGEFMGASAYIGRVSRLAVALGVGTAIVTGHGIASADGTDTTSSTSAASDTADTSANAGTPAKKDAPSNPTEPTASATEPTSTAKTSEPDAIKTPPKSATEPVGSGV